MVALLSFKFHFPLFFSVKHVFLSGALNYRQPLLIRTRKDTLIWFYKAYYKKKSYVYDRWEYILDSKSWFTVLWLELNMLLEGSKKINLYWGWCNQKAVRTEKRLLRRDGPPMRLPSVSFISTDPTMRTLTINHKPTLVVRETCMWGISYIVI